MLLQQYVRENDLALTDNYSSCLFLNRLGNPLTRVSVNHILQKYLGKYEGPTRISRKR